MLIPDDFSVAIDEFLSVRLAGASGTGDRFLMVGRPVDGLVRVREWTARSYNTAGEDFDVDPVDLLADIETVYAAGLSVMPEMYQIRRWLGS